MRIHIYMHYIAYPTPRDLRGHCLHCFNYSGKPGITPRMSPVEGPYTQKKKLDVNSWFEWIKGDTCMLEIWKIMIMIIKLDWHSMRTLCSARERPMRPINIEQWNFPIEFVHKIQSQVKCLEWRLIIKKRYNFFKRDVWVEGDRIMNFHINTFSHRLYTRFILHLNKWIVQKRNNKKD